MFKHILVPLDGSHLAEQVLPSASFVALHTGAAVTLIHVIEEDAPSQIHGEKHLQTAEDAREYLGRMAATAFPPTVRVDTHVHTAEVKNVAKSIVEHVGEFAPDLIMMCAHGSGGLRDLLYGNIAQQVIATGHTPVMIIFPSVDTPAPDFSCGNILVPLDGNPEHESGLPFAVSLAKGCGQQLYLLLVVPTLSTLKGARAATGTLLPASMSIMLDLDEENGAEYIKTKADAASRTGLDVTAEVARGDPVAVITEAAKKCDARLIVMGTHGHTGAGAFWAGSIAPRLSGQSHIPLLLVPVGVREE
jgi:nucleotide-binding universal stress UspA family protein